MKFGYVAETVAGWSLGTRSGSLNMGGDVCVDTATRPSTLLVMRRLSRMLAFMQGSSYLYFAVWAVVGREHYRSRHQLDADDWILNAHAGAMALIGAALLTAAVRNEVTNRDRVVGFAAAAGLAANDALLRRSIAPIYTADLAYEAALAALWVSARPR